MQPEASSQYPEQDFSTRHIGPRRQDVQQMLSVISQPTLDALVDSIVPSAIRSKKGLDLPAAASETEALAELLSIARQNQVKRSLIGMGYSDTITPPVILRNVLENPGWYTQYTPYQAEIAQGRLEALLNFQTLVSDLTALPISNASLLDEGTAAAEAMTLSFGVKNRDASRAFFVADDCHPQTIEVLKTRAEPLGIKLIVGDSQTFDFNTPIFGALLQYPTTRGCVRDYARFAERTHAADAVLTVACDLLALTLLKPPGEWGADIALGNSQRFGVPLGFGGPHAAFFATRDEFKRHVPGRIVGVTKDADGKNVIRLALQTREQHIRREKATSNICTAQVLLAVMASMYAVYHGPKRLRAQAERIQKLAYALRTALEGAGLKTSKEPIFDTVVFETPEVDRIISLAESRGFNLARISSNAVGISLDELSTAKEVAQLIEVLTGRSGALLPSSSVTLPTLLQRQSEYLTHPVFNSHHSEHEMLRYIFKLQNRDLSLAHSMIPLGSCTMKLNATAEMLPVTWPEFGRIHPFAPGSQTKGYQKLFQQLEGWLAEITGFSHVSLQPNAGSQGEYAGLLAIRHYHAARGDGSRKICLIPKSAHGTNPASAVMAGMQVVVVECDSQGNIDLPDLIAKAKEHERNLAALMVTYPSTHGVFEESIVEVCKIIHQHGGQVYMDGANMNAQVGLCRPGDFGADVCHLNLHKTFAIPHGGGGPGMGPIAVAKQLAPYLPGQGTGAVSAAPWGSASILTISWMYIRMLGNSGVVDATRAALLNANYIAKRLEPHFPVLYKGKNGLVAHECIFDLRPLKEKTGADVEDVAKRLMDYGFHAPTISFPVAGTLMVEPTESEPKEELDRFCEAMIAIRGEFAEIESGKADRTNNVLKNAPHTAEQIARADWSRPYSREQAVYPLHWIREHKFWPPVGRVNNVLGDRQLICTCPPIEDYS